jgi:hypothetical protein
VTASRRNSDERLDDRSCGGLPTPRHVRAHAVTASAGGRRTCARSSSADGALPRRAQSRKRERSSALGTMQDSRTPNQR